MKHFLPEWKVYLWKKLLLGYCDSARSFTVDDFVFFTDETKKSLMLADGQRGIDRLRLMEVRAKQGIMPDTNAGTALTLESRWYSFEPTKVFVALAELGMGESPCVRFENVRVSKNAIIRYQAQRKMYLESQEHKRIAGLVSGSRGGYIAPKPDDRFTDPYCGLTKSVYEKAEAGEDIHFAELADLVPIARNEFLTRSITFKISVDKERLASQLYDYIQGFVNDEISAPQGVRYFGFKRQSDTVFEALELRAQKFNQKNLPVTFEEIAHTGGWTYEWDHYRFIETLLALEECGRIKIKELRGAEVILSLEPASQVVAPVPLAKQSINDQIMSTLKVTKKIKMAFVPNNPGNPPVIYNAPPVIYTEAGMDRIGYVVISDFKIPLGGIGTTKFALVEMLCNPKMGVSKTIDSVVQAVGSKLSKSKKAPNVSNLSATGKLNFLKETTKEINRAITLHLSSKRIKDISFRFALKTDGANPPHSVRLEQKVGKGGK